ncbi:MAG TPA: DUF5723 family protein [Bacteroidia bacterium]|nr:DUF5723 family protein [Bacteroidia bacterium]
MGKLHAQDPMVNAWQPWWPDADTVRRHAITFSGEYSTASDALSNSFVQDYYQGEFLDSGKKARQEEMLISSNRLGIYNGYSASYSWRNNPDTLRWEFTAAIRDRKALYGKFSADAFRLAFEGNRAFEGSTADLGGSHLTYLHWQQLQLQVSYYALNKRSVASFGFSVLNGQQLQEINIREGKLFTASNGTSIDMTTDASYYSSDTARTRFFSNNGAGTSFNFRFSTYLNDSAPFLHHFSFLLQDLGYISWNKNALIYNVDTSEHFEGVDVSDYILNPSDIPALPTKDSLIGAPSKGRVITFLPMGLRAQYTLFTPWRMWMAADVRAWSYTQSAPQFSLLGGWKGKKEKVFLHSGISWGGFTTWQVPFELHWNINSRFGVTLGTTNLAGYMLPEKMRAQGLYTNLTVAF